ncbi:MAG: GAP family protein [Kineosporiaceae bacterium]
MDLTTGLIAQLAALAALDALNPATIAAVALLLLAPLRRPVAAALAFTAGAYAVVLGLGVALYLGAGAAADVVAGATVWVRRGALVLAGLLLLHQATRRLRDRHRDAVRLPAWVGPWTAAPLGVLVTGADLPNAFPYLVAVERLLAAAVAPSVGVLALACYAAVYVLPCLVLVAAAAARGRAVRRRLAGLHERLGGARTVRRSRRAAAGLAAAGLAAWGLATVV